jgi:hypothetical protein
LNSNGKIDIPVTQTPSFPVEFPLDLNEFSLFLFIYKFWNKCKQVFQLMGFFALFLLFLSYVSFTGEKIIKFKFYEESKNVKRMLKKYKIQKA